MKKSDIYFSTELDEKALTKILNHYLGKVAIISDETVGKLYGKKLFEKLSVIKPDVFYIEIKDGEQNKSRESKAYIEDVLCQHNCNRDTLLIAIGGGVITDLTGFVAATYNRGIDVIYIPTSLLAMVDAAIGGKTAINTAYGKNLIGAFYLPSAIFISPCYLKTLSHQDYISAFAEILKHAFIYDKNYLQQLINNHQALMEKNLSTLNQVIEKSMMIKLSVTDKDLTEKGLREILNFGHTIGHAIEKVANFNISHGQAVAIGMVIEAKISHQLGLLEKNELNTIVQTIKLFELPTTLPKNFNLKALIEACAVDKKRKGQKCYFVLLKKIGQPHFENDLYSHVIDKKIIENCLTDSLH